MVAISISLPAEIIVQIDKERRWINRSVALTKVLEYICSTPGTMTRIIGADKLPEYYDDEPAKTS